MAVVGDETHVGFALKPLADRHVEQAVAVEEDEQNGKDEKRQDGERNFSFHAIAS
ncbi:hypothetical protein [Sphingopyxis sp. C-1]|uniref:hypothetical protein n=1 Tax=Sphingopyxis sp. C-1 TaxID=262667 RepID=UPI00187C0BAC|nr:hypothetical protein [Sphingopyxis sp. C-1]